MDLGADDGDGTIKFKININQQLHGGKVWGVGTMICERVKGDGSKKGARRQGI